MAGFVEGMDRRQATMLPECLEDWGDENNAVAQSMYSSMRLI
jgi:hypothetical protein